MIYLINCQKKTFASKLFCLYTASKVSKYEVFSGPYFPVFSPNTGKYGSEKASYLDTFHAVLGLARLTENFYYKRVAHVGEACQFFAKLKLK